MADVSKFKIGTIIYNIKDAVARKVMKGAETNAAGEAGQVPAPEAGAANRYLRSDGTWQVPPDTNTTYGNMAGANTSAAGKAGLVPAPGAGAANRYLRSDGSWQVPPDTNTTYGNMTAATANAAGRAGLVPAPGAGAQGKYLRGDGTWQTPPDTNTVYTHPSTHPASMISQDASHRFVTDTEKTAWNGKVNTSDIINNCTSTATNKPLSAAQGKALWDKYTQLNGDLGKAIKELKFVDAVSATTISFNAHELKKLALPSPKASDISGYYLIGGCVQAWFEGTAWIVTSGFIGWLPGEDIFMINISDSTESGKLTARYLYAKK